MTYSMTLLASAVGSLEGEPVELDENQLAALFSTYAVSDRKDGAAVIPAKMRPCPAEGCIGKTSTDCGGDAFHRLDENVESLTGLMIDSDSGDVSAVLGKLMAEGITHYVWQTYSHTDAHPKHRLFVPFAAPLPLKNKQQWSKVFWPALIRRFGLDPVHADNLDKSCKNASRLYYAPSKPEGGTQRAWVHWGTEFDWSPVCDLSSVPLVEPLSATYRDPARPEGEFYVDLKGLRERLSAVHADAATRAILALLVKGDALCPPAVMRKKGDTRTRRASWLTATCWLANCGLGNEEPEELLQLARASYERECLEADVAKEEPTRWSDIEKMLVGAMGDATEYRAREAHRRSLREFANSLGKSTPVTEHATVTGEAEPAFDPELWKALVVMGDRGGETIITPTLDNIRPILLHHPDWHGAFRYNEYKQVVEVWGGKLDGEKPRPMRDSDATNVAIWFARQFKFKFSPAAYTDHLIATAELRSYHPLRDYLRECKARGSKSPGVLDRWLFDYCGVTSTPDTHDLLSTYGRKFLISCVARAFRPGCKVDTMPVFVGVQGSRKSTLLETLADNGRFFTDASITFDGSQNTSMIIATNWIVEAPELEGMASSSTQKQRATLSRRIDTFRLPYGRAIVSLPRCSVFSGSTNEPEFLTDSAGNRRFWVVNVGAIDVEGLREVVPSLWAEAIEAFEAGEEWWLKPEQQTQSNESNETHTVTDLGAEKLRSCVAKSPKKKDFYTVPEILDFLDLNASQARSGKFANTLRRAGFVSSRRYMNGVQVRGYLTPPELLAATTLSVVK